MSALALCCRANASPTRLLKGLQFKPVPPPPDAPPLPSCSTGRMSKGMARREAIRQLVAEPKASATSLGGRGGEAGCPTTLDEQVPSPTSAFSSQSVLAPGVAKWVLLASHHPAGHHGKDGVSPCRKKLTEPPDNPPPSPAGISSVQQGNALPIRHTLESLAEQTECPHGHQHYSLVLTHSGTYSQAGQGAAGGQGFPHSLPVRGCSVPAPQGRQVLAGQRLSTLSSSSRATGEGHCD